VPEVRVKGATSAPAWTPLILHTARPAERKTGLDRARKASMPTEAGAHRVGHVRANLFRRQGLRREQRLHRMSPDLE
jgi:hypothetical protein